MFCTNPAGDSWPGQIHKHVHLLTQQRWSTTHRRHRWTELSLWLVPSLVSATALKSQDSRVSSWPASSDNTRHKQWTDYVKSHGRLRLLTKAFPASTAWKNFRHSSQLPLFPSARRVKLSIQCNHNQVVITCSRFRMNKNTPRLYAASQEEGDDRRATGEDWFLFLPEAIFTTGSITGTLIGTFEVFMCSRRPMTPLLSYNKKKAVRHVNTVCCCTV